MDFLKILLPIMPSILRHLKRILSAPLKTNAVVFLNETLPRVKSGIVTVPIVFRGINGVSAGVASQHTQCFASLFGNIAGLKTVSIYDVEDARGLLKSAIRDNDPVIFMESEQMYGDKGEVPEGEYTIPLGVAASSGCRRMSS